MPNGFTTTDALVLREVKYKEADRILTLFTAENGKMTAKASSALRKSSKLSAATQQLTFSEMTLFENKGRTNVREAAIREPFKGLRENFANYALGCYFAECIEALSEENVPDPAILQLALNSLYALSEELYDPILIKASFELRLASLIGYAPDLEACVVCGKTEPEAPVLGTVSGHICCRTCRNAAVGITDYIDSESLKAMRFIVSAPAKHLFASKIEGESLEKFSAACEDFLREQCGRSFPTLDYWKRVK